MTDSQSSTYAVVEVSAEDAARAAAKYWWIVLLGGLASLAFGIWLVTKPVKAAHTVAVLLGIWLIVVGIIDLVGAAGARHRGSAVLSGIIVLILGLILAFKPDLPIKVIAVVWGIAVLLGGVVRIVVTLMDRGHGWGWRLLLGLLSAALGIVMVVWPTATVGVVFWIAGLSAILTGLIWVFGSFSMRHAPERLAESGGAVF